MDVADNRVAEFKKRVETEWTGDETARAWRKYYSLMKEQLRDVTQALVDAADVSPGMVVLDLASGTGEPALSLARKVAPVGSVTATDLSAPMLSVLRENAGNENVSNVETEVADAHKLRFSDNTFDRVTSRFGVMFFIELQRALGEVKRVLKPGGKAAFLVWGEPAPDTFFGATVAPFMKRMENPPDPDAPTPNRFAEPGKLRREMEQAGFRGVTEQILSLPAPLKLDPEGVMTFMLEIAAPFRNAVESLPESIRREAEQEAYARLQSLYDGTVISTKAPVIVVTGTK